MTIDDFDVNEISDKIAIRDEADSSPGLELAHNDSHNDLTISGCYHQDISNSPWHDDNVACNRHDDGHYDVFDDCCFNDNCCPEPIDKRV